MPRILIIDDSLYQRKTIRKMLKSEDYEILEAKSGYEGLELIATHNPDCVLLDLVMPEADGFHVLEALQNQGVKIPVIVISADIQESSRQRCLHLGATAMVHKPITAETGLEALVQEALKTA